MGVFFLGVREGGNVSQRAPKHTTDQLPQYIAWHPNPYSQGMDAMIQSLNMDLLSYAFSLFALILRVPKNKTEMFSSLDSECTSFEYPIMVPRTLKPLC